MDVQMSEGNELRQGYVTILSAIANVTGEVADSVLASCDDDVQKAIDVLLGLGDESPTRKLSPPSATMATSSADLEDIHEEIMIQNTLIHGSPRDDDDDDDIYSEYAPEDDRQAGMQGIVDHSAREGSDIFSSDDESSSSSTGLVVHALYFVPQVRETVSRLRRAGRPPGWEGSFPERLVSELVDFFALAHQPHFDRDNLFRLLSSLDQGQNLDAATTCYDIIAGYIEQYSKAHHTGADELSGIFSFSLGNVTFKKNESRAPLNFLGVCRLARLELGKCKSSCDLVSAITDNMTETDGSESSHNLIIEPSAVMPFYVRAGGRTVVASEGRMSPFTFPRSIFLDRFLSRNFLLVDDKRVLKNDLLSQVQQLRANRIFLTQSEGQDSLKGLEDTIYYYDHVADHRNDPERTASLKAVSDHLKDVLARIRSTVEGIDRQLSELHAKLETLYDCPELQAFQYDLRSVIVDKGVPSLDRLYLYASDESGRWWKTVNDDVEEVTEDAVLSDKAGCQEGGGYLLIYSRNIA